MRRGFVACLRRPTTEPAAPLGVISWNALSGNLRSNRRGRVATMRPPCPEADVRKGSNGGISDSDFRALSRHRREA
jgi:hypothetical protein